MDENILSLLIYPVNNINVTEKQINKIKEVISKKIKNISFVNINEEFLLQKDLKIIKSISTAIDDKDKQKYFDIARDITSIFYFNDPQLKRLSEIGKLLKIDKENTGFNFDLYNINEMKVFVFNSSVRKFSAISAVIGFLPLPIADFALLAPIQIGMISKISNLYNFKIDPKEFLKMVGGVIGAGLTFKITSKILCSLVPVIGWAINAAVAYAGTYAIAILTKRYIEVNGQLTKESIKEIWEKSFKDGKDEFQVFKEYIFKKKDDLLEEVEKYKKSYIESKEKSKSKSKKIDIKQQDSDKTIFE